ncbi:unnamed protein product [Withania somnifera]
MVQKRPFGEEDLYEVSSKQPRYEPSFHLVSDLELSRESVSLESYASGDEEDRSSGIIPDANKKLDSLNVAEVLFSSDKETEMGIHGSASNSSWPTSSTSEEDIRPDTPFHILTSPEYYYYFDHPFRAASHHREMYSSLLGCPQKMVPIGPDFQAELPEWGAYNNKDRPCIDGIHETLNPSQADENKIAGRTNISMLELELPADHVENIGERRAECSCEDIGSVRCVRLHKIEAREKLKLALGEETFVRLGFCDMGEVVAEKWSEEEEEFFHEVVFSNPASLATWEDYNEDAGEATWEDYKPVSFGSRKVFSDVQESCPGKLFDGNSSYKLFMQPQDQGLSNEVVEKEVQGSSCTSTDVARVTSESLRKVDNSKHWASDITGMGGGTKHDTLLEPCNGKERDVGYLSCARNEVDLLPTHTMIDEVFGDGDWIYKNRDG